MSVTAVMDRRVREIHGIDVSTSFANVLYDSLNQETLTKMAERTKRSRNWPRTCGGFSTEQADQMRWHTQVSRDVKRRGILDSQWPHSSRKSSGRQCDDLELTTDSMSPKSLSVVIAKTSRLQHLRPLLPMPGHRDSTKKRRRMRNSTRNREVSP